MIDKLPDKRIEASAPCRIDLGGTLDISTFHLPLARFKPVTFNAALDSRTKVVLEPYRKGLVKVSSKGFESAEFPVGQAPFDHPTGLMFAVASYFGVGDAHIRIESSSPVRSALGGSSVAAVALCAAFFSALSESEERERISRDRIVLLAHALEQSVAGVPCGVQDQLAAAYGGINAWQWTDRQGPGFFLREPLFEKSGPDGFSKRIRIAYCGIPHESKDINSRWVKGFVAGERRSEWLEIIRCAQSFVDALKKENYKDAAEWMNRETDIRLAMTPDVLDETGMKLAQAARAVGCGARFTGAGGGGCVWAVGELEDVLRLDGEWENILSERSDACMLDAGIDTQGLRCDGLCW